MILPVVLCTIVFLKVDFLHPLNAKLSPIYHLLALLGAHHILHVNMVRANIFSITIILSFVENLVNCVWNVMAHAQKPDFVFRRNGRVHLNRRGASVKSTAGSRGVFISGSNAGCAMFWSRVRVLATHSIRQFPLPFPSRASPCAITFQLDSTYFVTVLSGLNVTDKNIKARKVLMFLLIIYRKIYIYVILCNISMLYICTKYHCANSSYLSVIAIILKVKESFAPRVLFHALHNITLPNVAHSFSVYYHHVIRGH
jgi:hypothetical protein